MFAKKLKPIQLFARGRAIVMMKNEGFSFQEVADVFGLTKSLVFKIYEASEKSSLAESMYEKEDSEDEFKQKYGNYIQLQRYARRLYSKAVRNGIIKRKPCEREKCGEEKVEGHHPDYSNPLYLEWLCRKHHAQVHKDVKSIIKKEINNNKSTIEVNEEIKDRKELLEDKK